MSNQNEPETGSVKLLEYHQPGLTAGDYEISIEQVVKLERHNPIDAFTAAQKFTVAGERFELNPTNVHGVFPPDGNLGQHSNTFPHVILNRSTLPWERLADVKGAGSTVPWLALLLFDEDEKPKSKNLTLAELKQTSVEKFQPNPLELESGQHDTDKVIVIDVPAGRLKKIMPTGEELALLAHVRLGVPPKAKSNGKELEIEEELAPGEELAIIISNRLPQAGGTSFAYLVSVEKRFTKNSTTDKYEFDYQDAADNGLIRLVTLKSWSFACESNNKDFQQLLCGLNTAVSPSATLRLPDSAPAADKLLSRGFVPLPHHFRHGDQTASWFHGPLIPGQNTSPRIDLPARSADELLRYDPKLSMFDVSYAAAWQLGRLLALQDKAISTSLYQWKRQRAQSVAQAKQWTPRLPFQKITTVPDLPEPVFTWFDKLRLLEGVPFNYLVADERMLPTESIRFFRVDQAWIDCLCDGAFSIARVTPSDHVADKLHGMKSSALNLGEPLTGFLLRSEVVSGWPGLLVAGYAARTKTQPKEQAPKEQALGVVRMERFEGGVLMCVFRGQIGRVEIYLKAETLHFGLHLGTNPDGSTYYYKKLRDPDSGKPLPDDKPENTVKLEPRHWRSGRTANIPVLAESLKTSKSSQFALQMVEGAEKVIFRARP